MLWYEGYEFRGSVYNLANYKTIALRGLAEIIKMSETGNAISVDWSYYPRGKILQALFVCLFVLVITTNMTVFW